MTGCFARWPDGVQPFLEEDACPLAYCATPAGCLDSPDPVTTCDNTNCLKLRVACFTMRDCYLMFHCEVACYNQGMLPSCLDACDQGRSQEALDAKAAWDTCSLAKCP
jgi:hypothetical protein